MALPEIKASAVVSVGSSSEDSAPGWTGPDTLGPEMVKKLQAANPPQGVTRSSFVLSGEATVPGALKELGACDGAICEKVDLGVRVGYRFGLGSVPFAAHIQYNQPTPWDFSVIGRVSVGGEFISGDVPSAKEMEKVHISATQFQASAGVGAEFIYKKIPLLAMLTVQGNSGTDLGHGFSAEGGPTVFLSLAGGYTLFAKEGTKSRSSSTNPDDACKEAAAEVQLYQNNFDAAVGKCKDSALPVFEAMDKKLSEFKLSASDPTNHNEFFKYIRQFSDGIDSAEEAKKLSAPEAIVMKKKLVGHYAQLLANMFSVQSNYKNSLQTALRALNYPIFELLNEKPADADIKKNADAILNDILECAQAEGKAYLPNVLEQLVEKGKGSAWLKTHKKDLLDAAKKIPKGIVRTDIEKSINKTFK